MDARGYYWTSNNELRECTVLRVMNTTIVIDAETTDEVDVDPTDVLIEKPEP